MFSRITTYCLLFLGILTLFWGFFLVRVRPSDVAAMEKNEASTPILETTHQQRKGVVKEIWFTQEDNSRLHYRIFSESSLLTLKPDGRHFDIVEKLEKIKCWMQDKLYDSNMQQIRFLAAEDGLYRYTSQEFLAKSVALSLYRLNGHELPKEMSPFKPFLKGIAQDVSFAVSGNNPQFKAQHFNAELGGQ